MSIIDWDKIINNNIDKKSILSDHIDIVFSGGGLGCFYNLSIIYILYNMVKEEKIKIRYIYGVCAGSILGILLLCLIHSDEFKLSPNELRNQYDMLKEYTNDNKDNTLLDNMTILLENILPKNAHEICSDKLFITVNKVTLFGLKRENVSKFESFEDLISIIKCSSTVPFCTVKGIFTKYKDSYYIDGILPLYEKKEYQVLYIEYLIMFYRHVFKPTDSNIDNFIFDGYNEFIKFLYYNKTSKRFYLL